MSGIGVASQPLQVSAKVCCVLITHVAIFLQRLSNDAVQLGRQRRIQPHWRGRLAVQNGLEYKPRCVATKRQRARRHFIEHRTKENKSVRASSSFPLTCSGDM